MTTVGNADGSYTETRIDKNGSWTRTYDKNGSLVDEKQNAEGSSVEGQTYTTWVETVVDNGAKKTTTIVEEDGKVTKNETVIYNTDGTTSIVDNLKASLFFIRRDGSYTGFTQISEGVYEHYTSFGDGSSELIHFEGNTASYKRLDSFGNEMFQ